MAALTHRVVVVVGADSVPAALGVAAPRLGLSAVPPVGHLCPRCGSDRHGRPFLQGLADVRVSISRSSGVLVVALADVDIGADVERADDPRFAEVAGILMHSDEAVPDSRGTARTWVRKEAALKAWGPGLGLDPRTIRLTRPDEAPAVLAAPPPYGGLATQLVDLDLDDGLIGCVAVVAPATPEVSVVRAAPGAPSHGASPARGP